MAFRFFAKMAMTQNMTVITSLFTTTVNVRSITKHILAAEGVIAGTHISSVLLGSYGCLGRHLLIVQRIFIEGKHYLKRGWVTRH